MRSALVCTLAFIVLAGCSGTATQRGGSSGQDSSLQDDPSVKVTSTLPSERLTLSEFRGAIIGSWRFVGIASSEEQIIKTMIFTPDSCELVIGRGTYNDLYVVREFKGPYTIFAGSYTVDLKQSLSSEGDVLFGIVVESDTKRLEFTAHIGVYSLIHKPVLWISGDANTPFGVLMRVSS
jgi:hypothetical protein